MQLIKKLFNPREGQLLAIEVSNFVVKILALSKTENNLVVTTLLRQQVEHSIEETLKIALSQLQLKTNKVVMAVPYSKTLRAKQSIPQNLSKQEIAHYCKFAAAKQLGVPAEQIYLDFHLLNQQQLMAEYYALPATVMVKYQTYLRANNLIPVSIDLDAFAIERCMRWHLRNMQGNITVVNFTHTGFLLLVLNAAQLIFVHETLLTTERLQFIPEIGAKVMQAIESTNSTLKQRSAKILITGDGKFFAALQEQLQAQFALEVEVFNPLQGLQLAAGIPADQLYSDFTLCCGLALRQFSYASH